MVAGKENYVSIVRSGYQVYLFGKCVMHIFDVLQTLHYGEFARR